MTDEKKKEENSNFSAPVGTGAKKELNKEAEEASKKAKADAEKAEKKAKADAEKAEKKAKADAEKAPCTHEETERVMFGTNAYEQCMKCNETIRKVK